MSVEQNATSCPPRRPRTNGDARARTPRRWSQAPRALTRPARDRGRSHGGNPDAGRPRAGGWLGVWESPLTLRASPCGCASAARRRFAAASSAPPAPPRGPPQPCGPLRLNSPTHAKMRHIGLACGRPHHGMPRRSLSPLNGVVQSNTLCWETRFRASQLIYWLENGTDSSTDFPKAGF